MIYPGFIGAAFQSQSISVAGDMLINLYPEVQPQNSAGNIVYYGTPGSVVACTLPRAPVRGITYLSGACFAVGGNQLYQIGSDNSIRLCASGRTLPAGTSPVSIETDGKQFVVMAVNGELWVYSIGSDSLIPISSSIVPGAATVAYCDTYYLVNVPNTQQFFFSSLRDATTWSALDFASKEGYADLLVSIIISHRELWLMGSRSGEIWWDTGNATNPWQRIQGPFIENGIAAAFSLAKMDSTNFWLSEDDRGARMVMKANGYNPQRISTFALEYILSTYSKVSDAVAFTYQEQGHSFYVITFPSAVVPVTTGPNPSTNRYGATWAFDDTNGMWHQRDYLYPQFGQSQQIRGWVHAFAFGKHLVGDYENGNIYDQSVNYYTEGYNAAPIRRLRRAPHIVNQRRWVKYPGFELHIQEGVVPQSGPGSDPKFNLRKSSDGGYKFGNYLETSAGMVGNYRNRVIWRRLGEARDAVFEVTSDEPIQHAWVNAYLTPDPVESDR